MRYHLTPTRVPRIKELGDSPHSPVVRTPTSQCWGRGSIVIGELGSCKPCGQKKKKKDQIITSIGEDVEKLEASCVADGNEKRCS